MKSLRHSFNIYFALICVALVANGCALFGSKKEQSTIRLYLEGAHADRTSSGTVLVTSNKYPYTVEREPFLDEGELAKASIVDDPDGTFAIQLLFNDHGALLLDMYTASNKDKHIIVFSQFPNPKEKKKAHKKTSDSDDADLVEKSNPAPLPDTTRKSDISRQSGWLAAVLVRNRVSNGIFRFTPDASREEALRIVRGLRNVISTENKSREK